jgi:hypothetical protein
MPHSVPPKRPASICRRSLATSPQYKQTEAAISSAVVAYSSTSRAWASTCRRRHPDESQRTKSFFTWLWNNKYLSMNPIIISIVL